MNGLFQDTNGNISSKRVAGFIMLFCAVALAALGVFRDSTVAAELVWPFVTGSAAALGIGVLEKKG
jgi:hypothetical protein